MIDLKNKVALVYDYGNFIYVAQKLAESFGKVYYVCPWQTSFPTQNIQMPGVGVPNLIKVDELESVEDEVDLFYFTDLYRPALQQRLKDKGKLVFGSGWGGNMEIRRIDFLEFMQSVGLPTPEYEVIEGLENLEKYLEDKQDKWIKVEGFFRGDLETYHYKKKELSKTMFNDMRHSLGVAQYHQLFVVCDPIDNAVEIGSDLMTIDGKYPKMGLWGIEIKDCGYAGIWDKYTNFPKQLLNVNNKLETELDALEYKGCISTEVRIQKGKPGILGDITCFSADTEILTESGWKYFYDLSTEDKVCTLNPENNKIEYHKPYNHISYHYTGEMISITNKVKSIECLVTPNHSVWRTDRNGKRLFSERADNLTTKGYIPRTGKWDEPDIEYFELPEYHHEWDWIDSRDSSNILCRKVKHFNSIKINMDDWVAFMAWYLSEGNLGGPIGGKGIQSSISITQSKNQLNLISVLNKIGFKFKQYGEKSFQINSVQLSHYLHQFGLCDKKFIPEYIKKCSRRQIRIFLDNYLLGDGSVCDRNRYYTTSKQMANDIQELIFKVGSVGNIRKGRLGKGSEMKVGNGKTYIRNHDIYIIQENNKRDRFWFETTGERSKRFFNKIPYTGLVYDVTVKNHIIYVRRNGKPFWSGNCRNPEPPTSVMIEMIENYAECVWKVASGEIPEPISKNRYGVMIVIKSEMAQTEPVPIYYPEEISRWIKIKNLCVVDGIKYYIPQNVEMKEIGAVVGLGNTLEDAILECQSNAKKVEGPDLEMNDNALNKAFEEINKFKSYGITGWK